MDVRNLAAVVGGRAAEIVGSSHGVPGTGAVVQALLSDLLVVQSQQARTLSRIEKDVQRLLDGPWRTAQLHLRESKLPGRSPAQVVKSLEAAAQQLRQGLALQSGDFAAAYVAFDLAVVLAALHDRQASTFYAKVAITSASDPFARRIEEMINRHFGLTNRPIRSKLRDLHDYFKPVGQHPDVREWYLLAVAVEPLCGQQVIADQVGRLTYGHVSACDYVRDHDPDLCDTPRPAWLPE